MNVSICRFVVDKPSFEFDRIEVDLQVEGDRIHTNVTAYPIDGGERIFFNEIVYPRQIRVQYLDLTKKIFDTWNGLLTSKGLEFWPLISEMAEAMVAER